MNLSTPNFPLEEVDTNYILHYLSALSGPIVSCSVGTIFCSIPRHNVFAQPQFWYEYQICILVGILPFIMCLVLIQAMYWANFEIKEKFKTLMHLLIVGESVFILGIIVYYFIWTDALGLTSPMAFSFYIGASVSYAIIFFVVWFR